MWFPDRLRTTLWRCRSIVWIASWLVPRKQRTLWRSEQDRKFWHWCHYLSESGHSLRQNRLIVARHCWAMFPDAFWIRFDRERFLSSVAETVCALPSPFWQRSRSVVAVLVLGSGIVPATRAAFTPPIPHPAQVVLITLDGNGINGKFSRTRSDTLLDLASVWSKSKLVEGVAPFSWAPGKLLLAGTKPAGGDRPCRSGILRNARCEAGSWSHLYAGRRAQLPELRAAELRRLAARIPRRSKHCGQASHAEWLDQDGDRSLARQLPPDLARHCGMEPDRPCHAVYEFPAPGRRRGPLEPWTLRPRTCSAS